MIKSLKGLSKSFEKHENIIKMAVTILAIVAALLVFGEKGEKDTIVITESYEGAENQAISDQNYQSNPANTSAIKIQENTLITVDISGEVNNPGVYTIKDDGRLNDLIEMAGGLTDKADINRINRAGYLTDGVKIYIPSLEDSSPEGVGIYSESSSYSERVNINTANKSELETVPGIGPITADKIIHYRETISRFQTIEDIMNVSGIGEKTFEKIKDYICI